MMTDDELISAYFDDELTADERARAERLLAESPTHRQLLDELQSLRTGLRALPNSTLGDDFASRVLRRAEQEVLLKSPPAERPVGRGEPWPEDNRARGWNRARRPVIYALVSLAAGLFVLVFTTPRQPQPAAQVAETAVPELRDVAPTPATNEQPVAPLGAMSLRNSAAEGERPPAPAVPPPTMTLPTMTLPTMVPAEPANEPPRAAGVATTATEAQRFRDLKSSLEKEGAGLLYESIVSQTAGGFRDVGRDAQAGPTSATIQVVVVDLPRSEPGAAQHDFERALGQNNIEIQSVTARALAREERPAAPATRQAVASGTNFVDAYYVEAPAEQLSAVLHDLTQQHSEGLVEKQDGLGLRRSLQQPVDRAANQPAMTQAAQPSAGSKNSQSLSMQRARAQRILLPESQAIAVDGMQKGQSAKERPDEADKAVSVSPPPPAAAGSAGGGSSVAVPLAASAQATTQAASAGSELQRAVILLRVVPRSPDDGPTPANVAK